MEFGSYPLLKSGGFNWALFPVDRNKPGDQPMAGHYTHRTPDVGCRFPEIYGLATVAGVRRVLGSAHAAVGTG